MSRYQRYRYAEVVTYEFLLPLTREAELRMALDDLFYLDTLRERIAEIGLAEFEPWIPGRAELGDDGYVDRICETIGRKFGGYSLNHVSGRYRGMALRTRAEAAAMIGERRPYLVDETTAVVRFIVPVESSRTLEGGDSFEPAAPMVADDALPPAVRQELEQIHFLFFEVLVEAVVGAVRGEEVIWLFEMGRQSRVYAWEQQPSP